MLRRQQPEAEPVVSADAQPDQQVQTATLPPSEPHHLTQATVDKEHVFEEADTDKDGYVTRAESKVWWEAHPAAHLNKFSSAQFDEHFNMHDKDGDGRISIKEELGGWNKGETDWLSDSEREGVFKNDGISAGALAVRALT